MPAFAAEGEHRCRRSSETPENSVRQAGAEPEDAVARTGGRSLVCTAAVRSTPSARRTPSPRSSSSGCPRWRARPCGAGRFGDEEALAAAR